MNCELVLNRSDAEAQSLLEIGDYELLGWYTILDSNLKSGFQVGGCGFIDQPGNLAHGVTE